MRAMRDILSSKSILFFFFLFFLYDFFTLNFPTLCKRSMVMKRRQAKKSQEKNRFSIYIVNRCKNTRRRRQYLNTVPACFATRIFKSSLASKLSNLKRSIHAEREGSSPHENCIQFLRLLPAMYSGNVLL